MYSSQIPAIKKHNEHSITLLPTTRLRSTRLGSLTPRTASALPLLLLVVIPLSRGHEIPPRLHV